MTNNHANTERMRLIPAATPRGIAMPIAGFDFASGTSVSRFKDNGKQLARAVAITGEPSP